MALNKRARSKGMESAQKLLPAGIVAREYVVGRANARMTKGAAIAIGVFGVAFIAALAAGQVIVPGGLLLVFVVRSIRPPRSIVATNEGIAVLDRNFVHARPSKLLAMIPAESIRPHLQGSGPATIDLGRENVTFPRKEADRLRTAFSDTSTAPFVPAI
jgi:hypothetical protein